jgi:hypothetical protein
MISNPVFVLFSTFLAYTLLKFCLDWSDLIIDGRMRLRENGKENYYVVRLAFFFFFNQISLTPTDETWNSNSPHVTYCIPVTLYDIL